MNDDSILFNNIRQEIDALILERSKFLLFKKFEKYNSEILKIYSQFNINKSLRIDAMGSPQIDIKYLDQILILILKEVNLFLLELSSPKDIFISFFLISSQKENEMEGIIKHFQQEIISKNLTEKYNNIFYEEKIKPIFFPKIYTEQIYDKENFDEDEIIKEINISEYNTKGKKIKDMKILLEENKNNMKLYNIQIKNNENKYDINKNNISISFNRNNLNFSFNNNNNLDKNILYIETLPQILIDYLKVNSNLALVEIDEEFPKELNSYNKKLLYKIKEYDELYSHNKIKDNNIKTIRNELNQNSLQLQQVQKSIDLYKQLIIDKKEKNENTIFLEDMLNKLIEKEKVIINQMKEIKEKSFVLNLHQKFNKYSINEQNLLKQNDKMNIQSLNLSSKISNNSCSINNTNNKEIPKLLFNYRTKKIQDTQNQNKTIKKYKLSSSINKMPKLIKINNSNESPLINIKTNKNDLTAILKSISSKEKETQRFNDYKKNSKLFTFQLNEKVINIALNDIFSFYNSLSNNNDDTDNNSLFDFESFQKFCKDFKIFIPENKIESIFYESINDSNDDNDNNNNLETDNKNKINLNQFKSAITKLSLEFHEIKKQKLKKMISDKNSIINYMELREYLRQEEEKNHNKFTEKITGGIAKRSLEKNQFEFISKYKKLKTDISKYEYDYEKESKLSLQKILENFYYFLGIGDSTSNCYKNKIKIKSNIFVENALKKYGYTDILKNYKNFNGTGNNNFNYSTTNKNNSISMRTIKRNSTSNLFNFKTPNNFKNNNQLFNNNSGRFSFQNKFNFNHKQNIYLENNINNNRYNLKNIDELEEIDDFISVNKKMNKNYSALEFKGKGLNNNINNMSINILPQISYIRSDLYNNNINLDGQNPNIK